MTKTELRSRNGAAVRRRFDGWASQRRRVLRCLAFGGLLGIVAGFFVPWPLAMLLAWDGVAASFLASVWPQILRLDGPATRAVATQEDNSRSGADALLLSAAILSLGGSALNLALKVDASDTVLEVLFTVGAVATVALSWGVVHTIFTLRYAHLYYRPPEGGIDFSSDQDPDYYDFAYVAFTVGMTFQVSDTDIAKRLLRRTVLRHALLSFLFGAVILAVTINVLGSLFN